MSDPLAAPTVVLGLGNSLLTDDGLGLAALEHLRDGWALDGEVELVDGGTWGMRMLPIIEDAHRLILLDAINDGREAGELIVLERDELPKLLAVKISPHEIDLREMLALAELRGTVPKQTVAIGLQPERVEMGTELSEAVRAGIPAVAAAAVERLRAWGHRCAPRVAAGA